MSNVNNRRIFNNVFNCFVIQVLPPLNLQVCLQNAIVEGNLSLTIPWVVKYLAMMDAVSLRLPYYKQILELLFCIHSAINRIDFSTSDYLISQQAVVLLKSSLCWLFELPNFPKDSYTIWQKNCKVKELKSLKHLQTDRAIPTKCCLDKLEIITDRTMRICCPRVESTFSTFNGKFECRTNLNINKHITPVTSQLRKVGGTTQTKHLEVLIYISFYYISISSISHIITLLFSSNNLHILANNIYKHIFILLAYTLIATTRGSLLSWSTSFHSEDCRFCFRKGCIDLCETYMQHFTICFARNKFEYFPENFETKAHRERPRRAE